MLSTTTRYATSWDDIENPEAKQLFELYGLLINFDKQQDWEITSTDGKLKHDTIRNAASIVHDAASELEWGEE